MFHLSRKLETTPESNTRQMPSFLLLSLSDFLTSFHSSFFPLFSFLKFLLPFSFHLFFISFLFPSIFPLSFPFPFTFSYFLPFPSSLPFPLSFFFSFPLFPAEFVQLKFILQRDDEICSWGCLTLARVVKQVCLFWQCLLSGFFQAREGFYIMFWLKLPFPSEEGAGWLHFPPQGDVPAVIGTMPKEQDRDRDRDSASVCPDPQCGGARDASGSFGHIQGERSRARADRCPAPSVPGSPAISFSIWKSLRVFGRCLNNKKRENDTTSGRGERWIAPRAPRLSVTGGWRGPGLCPVSFAAPPAFSTLNFTRLLSPSPPALGPAHLMHIHDGTRPSPSFIGCSSLSPSPIGRHRRRSGRWAGRPRPRLPGGDSQGVECGSRSGGGSAARASPRSRTTHCSARSRHHGRAGPVAPGLLLLRASPAAAATV